MEQIAFEVIDSPLLEVFNPPLAQMLKEDLSMVVPILSTWFWL